MAESQPQNAFSKSSKEKKSMLDDDFGKEFLSSWKSKDDSLDFGPNTVSTGKKKSFNFGNLDMDFDLDGNFGKFSSFKVDMPDLDFASPAAKAVPNKETSAAASGATSRKNHDAIFSFDFNEFDNFELDSSLKIETEKLVKNVNNKGVNSVSSECQETRDPKFKQPEINEAADNEHYREPDLPAADNGTTSFVEIGANSEETANLSDKVPAMLRTSGESILSHEEAPKITIISTGQLPDSSDVAIEGESNGKQIPCIIFAQPVGGQELNVRNGSDVQTNYVSCDAKTDSWHGIVEKTTEVSCPDDVMKLPQKNPNSLTSVAQQYNENERVSGDAIEDIMETEPSPNDLSSEAIATSSLSCGSEIKKDVQTSAPKFLGPLRIEAAGDSVIAEKKTASTVTQTKDFKMVKETKKQVCQPPLSDIELPPLGRKGFVALQLSSSTNQRDPEAIRNLAGNSSSAARETAAKPFFPERKKNAISLGNMREVLNSGGLQKGRKLVDNLRISDKETDKGNSVVQGSLKSIQPLLLKSNEKSSASSVDKPSELTHKTMPSSRIGLSRMGMNSNSRLVTVEDSKSVKTSSDLFNLKISGTVESIKDNSPLLLKSESNFSGICRIKEGKENLGPMNLHSVVNADRKSLASIKRKISEVSKEDAESFNTPKRLSPSPNESRIQNNCSNFKPTTGSSVVENQVCSQDNLVGSKVKSFLYDHSTYSWETPGVNFKELEITSNLEDKGNVEKAEAYGKALDDLCCMLRKKNEEAKEFLVRAIVNNNHLLMLNHPMFDEKIRLAQKFAARLTLIHNLTTVK